VRNGSGQRLPCTDWHILQQQVDQAAAMHWPNPVPELPAVPGSTAETFTFAYQPSAAEQAAAMDVLQQRQLPPQTAQDQQAAAAGQPSTAQLQPGAVAV
jgi:hypothetical protein